MNSSIGGVGAILVNRLAKQLHVWSSLKYALTERHEDEVKPGEAIIFGSFSPQNYVRARF
jgi:hypothetical protein